MDDKLGKRYRNISGTILVINDLNYLEIAINEVIDLSLFSDDFLNKSRGLREHIALKNLIPDVSGVQAKQIDENTFKTNQMFGEDLIKKLTQEIKDNITIEQNTKVDIELVKNIASEIGKEISKNISAQNSIDVSKLYEILQSSNIKNDDKNPYEQNISNSSINKIQEALEKRFPNTQQKQSIISEENFDSDDNNISDLKDLLKNSGGKNND